MIQPVYDMDGMQIFHGDCREILPQLPKVDLVLTDIPFNVNLNYLSYKDRLPDDEYVYICREWFNAFKLVSDFFIVKSPTKTMPIVHITRPDNPR